MRIAIHALSLLGTLALLNQWSCVAAAACDTSDAANPPARYEEGQVVNGIYASSSAHGPLLNFPGGAQYDLYHHLGYEPVVVQLYWSFSISGVGEFDAGNSLTPASGNSAEILLKNDKFIRVKNDSCVDFWLMVTAFGDPRPSGDAGAPSL